MRDLAHMPDVRDLAHMCATWCSNVRDQPHSGLGLSGHRPKALDGVGLSEESTDPTGQGAQSGNRSQGGSAG